MQDAILSLDIGTSLTKAVLFDPTGRELDVAEHAYPLHMPAPDKVELDPHEMWKAVLEVIKMICDRHDPNVHVLALTLSTQGGSLIPVGADNNPTHHAITWLDRRSEEIVRDWRRQGVDQRIRQISGWAPQPGLPLASICALRQSQPEVFATTHKFLSVNDFFVHQLMGDYFTNPSMAGEMLLTDIRTGAWSQELCELAGLNIDQLSPILPSEAICGELKPEVSRQTGLPEGTPLINGGQDHSCEALALGMITAGDFLLACGTAWVINGVTESSELANIPPEMALNYHVIPDRWIASQFLGGFGAGMEWWLNQFWQNLSYEKPISRDERYRSFNEALEGTQPGSSGVLFYPVSGTPRLGGSAGGFSGVRLDHTLADFGRAVLEGSGFELRCAVENIRAFRPTLEGLWMVGGATRSRLWPQILADITGIPISLTQYTHGPALGAAILAAKSLGFIDDFPQWVSAQTIEPNQKNALIYDDRYAAYQHLTEKLIL